MTHTFTIKAYQKERHAHLQAYTHKRASKMYDFQQMLIENVFKDTRVVEHYGFSENAGAASKCGRDVYHEDFELGHLELSDTTKTNVGLCGNLLATGFQNLAMPFIRYDIGDTATFSEEDDDKRKELVEENNKLLSGLVNIFVDKVIEKLHNTYKITVSELPYNIKLYLLDLPNGKISKRLTLSVTTIGSFDFNNCTTTKTDILSINIEE